MKQTIKTVALLATMTLPAMGWAQSSQLLPDDITEIRLEDYAALRVMQGDENRLTVNGNARQLGTYKGARLTLKETDSEATLYLKPGRSMCFNTQDFSLLNLVGDFAPFDSLSLHAEDYSRINYSGNDGDTLRIHRLTLKCEDYSRIVSSRPVQFGIGRHSAGDYSLITLDAVDLNSRLAPEGVTEDLYTNSDFGRINTGRYTVDGELKHPRVEYDTDKALEVMDHVTTAVGDLARHAKKKVNRHPWGTELDFAWGWNNWGDQIGSGFSGVDGAAGASTTFHNIQLAVNVPVINVSGFALKAGLGLEWNRYVFNTPEVLFDPTADPKALVAGTWGAGVANSYLKTCHVTVPIKLEFGNPDRWHFSLTALPGLNWTGKNSGLRRHYNEVEAVMNEHTDKDRSVNPYLNPYMLDVRVAVQYDCMGVYLQVSTLSAFKDGCQDLYPIKFGIIL